MVRSRPNKGGRPQSVSAPPKAFKLATMKSGTKNGADIVLREQVETLGGGQGDFELVKDVEFGKDDAIVLESSRQDPTLSKDVSIFLKQLTLAKNEPRGTEKQKSQKLGSPQKSQKEQMPKDTKPNAKPRAKSAQTDFSSTQMPTKVSFNPKTRYVVQPTAQWYSSVSPVPASPSTPITSPAQLASLTSRASDLHTTDMQTFQASSSTNSTSEASFLSKIIHSGTLSDRLSALTLLVQSSPLHNTKALETLKGMAERGKGKGGREESLKALRCVVDWWVGGGVPHRKLKYFRDQPLRHPSVTDVHLLLWFFEDWLKKYFFSILQILEALSLDSLPYVRTQALTLIFTLLREKPEQEQNLLRLLVNKLGDTEKTLCSRASYHLLQLLQSHPMMKSVVVREIIGLVLRPPAPATSSLPSGIGKHVRFTDMNPKQKSKPPAEKKGGNAHARYYATITFNQLVLTPGDRDVALKLIGVYFELFRELLGERESGDVHEESTHEGEAEDLKMDTKGRLVSGGRKGKVKGKGKGMVTEVRGAAGFTEVEDAHSRVISAILTGVNRALPFAKIDAGDMSLNKHIDTLFLITHTTTFNISIQALVLIQQITASLTSSSSLSSTSKSIIDRYYRTLYASLHDYRLATTSKQAMYLNLLFKSIKADAGCAGGERVKALVRRFVQVLVSGGAGATEFIAGGLYLLGELFSTIPDLRSLINGSCKPDGEAYDSRKRDPQYAHASSSPLWELTPLRHHYHPAIALHARQLLASQPLTASADLSQNTLSHFLDRFVYKNPKKNKSGENGVAAGRTKGPSLMQPAATGLDGTGVKLVKGEVDDDGLMNETAFLKKRPRDVPVDQVFFHQYFTKKNEREREKSAKAAKRKGHVGESADEDESMEDEANGEASDAGDDSQAPDDDAEEQVGDTGEGDSDVEEAEIWKAMKATLPKSVGEDDDLIDVSDVMPSDLDVDGDLASQGDDDDALSLVENSDNEDLVSLDGDVPDGLITYDGADASDGSDEEEWGGIGCGANKRKREETASGKSKKRKLKTLPTFASYEDYAKMIEGGEDDNV